MNPSTTELRPAPKLEDLTPEVQAWVRLQVADTKPWSDEYATHVAQLFFTGEFILVSDSGCGS